MKAPKPVLIIAEAGVNHNGDLNIAFRLIEAAAKAGADYVKFQTFRASDLVSATAVKADYQIANNPEEAGESQQDMLSKLELSYEDHLALIDCCKKNNIRFFSTAFDMESIELLRSLDPDLWKIPSGEITNLPYLEAIGRLGKDVIISTGMCTMEDIAAALTVLTGEGTPLSRITVLHCNTEYPTPFADVNLSAMAHIRDTFGTEIGYSDHTQGIEVPVAAVALGARVIEKHFTIDRTMKGPDHKASLEPDELALMVSSIRHIEEAMGDGLKRPSASERKNMTIARKSIHLKHEVKAGHILTTDDLVMKRPGTGISPMKLYKISGSKVLRDLPRDHQLSITDLA